MSSPKPADHPLPISPDPNTSPNTTTLPLALPPDAPDLTTPPSDPETEALIESLRASLAAAQQTISTQTTRLSSLSDVETELGQLKDQYAFLSAAKEAVESQLQEEIKRREVAEENVEMLRGQVEQARRGVMVLQKQEADRKRMSTISGYSTAGGVLGLGLNGEEEILNSTTTDRESSSFNSRESKLVKRQSIMRSHRRQSSQSEPSLDQLHERGTSLVTSPNMQNPREAGNTLRPIGQGGLRELRLGHSPSSATIPTATLPSPNVPLTSSNPHQSGYFDDQTSEPPSSVTSKTTELPSKKEIEAIEEATRLRSELLALQNKLDESEEARIASESCLKALREFMAQDPNAGPSQSGSGLDEGGEMSVSTAELLKGIRLPPLPTDRDADEEQRNAEAEKAKLAPATGGWGFKLWNAKSSPSVTSPGKELPLGAVSPQQKTLSPIENRSRAGSTATVSPIPTATDDLSTPTSGLTSSTTASSQTPLSSFVSNWTKGVTSPPTTASTSSPSTERPSSTRKISVTNFFSRGAKKDVQPATTPEAVKEQEEEKELPTPPTELMSDDQSKLGLEPSPEISTRELLFDDSKRYSKGTSGTTVTELEDELGTPQSSLKGVGVGEEGEVKSEGDKGKEKMEEVAL
ncbi:hypothetical protein I204_04005 [Kwoniella mangroviensis CBS 8886]|uniref:uncharacterized protein n=1 Tax=Kwoniella mangroviensis CBS 8507 TaxID=1296122 RepID=UPI00080D1FD9|nr:uncharacterized protein I203_05565 [Kwoniella mangroviensis CBS 8507]OCF65318.1 hypothetical protein I203_05565 [Kwoniella mangroviensis CBS 8507]OCF75155.1 hypothetical protein I204_04005 [Kwoniella mangroviensis CBS 8886]